MRLRRENASRFERVAAVDPAVLKMKPFEDLAGPVARYGEGPIFLAGNHARAKRAFRARLEEAGRVARGVGINRRAPSWTRRELQTSTPAEEWGRRVY